MMFIYRRIMPAVLAVTAAAGLCWGEDPAAAKFYRLDFVVKEVDGSKVLNSRAYSMTASDGYVKSSIRAGSKVPSATNTSYIDVGVNIDVLAIKEVQNRLSFRLLVEIASIPAGSASENAPLIRQNKWDSELLAPFKKPTVVFSSDSLDAKSQLQIEVTASPIP
jgi:Pyruvate/2-oxoacid:ferredoxin oxidoreductase gamma subunit